ncbi:serine/threonine-protein kinase [Nocardioides sp. YIM 152315]|uniref:serine/threonine-protein kinase n=1 Tax=Nocardioides sp. YIM 152315 TaxID=3031760 RepID=UPI0023DA59F3|nr:serine/threonine-protein kinase [Nocardioides sp. YIM 152315]MDF1603226.1 serine/threonine-protein kinase [Nocardioides sp. YIM 152315]
MAVRAGTGEVMMQPAAQVGAEADVIAARGATAGVQSALRRAATGLRTSPPTLRAAPSAPGKGPDSARTRPGTLVVQRYRLLEPLGAGGTGSVWLAQDTVLGRRVAVKRLDASGTSGARRALQEARATVRVAHPNIVVVHDVVVDRDEQAWIVMQALQGSTLADQVSRHGGLPVSLVHQVAETMVAALDSLHAGGLVHRDVKPSNIHLGTDGRVVLTDLGIAAPLGRSGSRDDLLTGTLGYIAPESVVSGDYSARSDMYGLGAALWFAIEGAPAFAVRSVEDLIEHAMTAPAPPLARRAGWLEPVITGLLQSDPDDRWTAARARTHLRAHRPADRPLVSGDGPPPEGGVALDPAPSAPAVGERHELRP